MDETRTEIDIRSNITLTSIGAKTVALNNVNESKKKAYTIILSVFNDGSKLPPMIIFDGLGTSIVKKLDSKGCVLYFNGQNGSTYNNKEGHKYWIDNVFLKNLNIQ